MHDDAELQHLVVFIIFIAICPCAIFARARAPCGLLRCGKMQEKKRKKKTNKHYTVDRMVDRPKPNSKHDSFRLCCVCNTSE